MIKISDKNRIETTTITGEQLNELLDYYAQKVEAKFFPKIGYTSWKEYKQWTKHNTIHIFLYFENGNIDRVTFYNKDNKYEHTLESGLKRLFRENWVYGIPKKLEWTSSKEISPTLLTTTAIVDKSINASPIEYVTSYNYTNDYNELKKSIDDIYNKLSDNKGDNKSMTTTTTTNNMFNFDFGPVTSLDCIRFSTYGFAVRSEGGNFVAYDKTKNRLVDVQILNFECGGLFYKIPKAIGKVNPGDVVFHNGTPVFVREVAEDKSRFTAIDPQDGTEKTIMPSYSPFGFDYITTLVSLVDGFNTPADEANPFGGILPLIMLNNGSRDINQMLPMMLLMGDKLEMDNPLMWLAFSGNMDTKNMNPFMALAFAKAMNK